MTNMSTPRSVSAPPPISPSSRYFHHPDGHRNSRFAADDKNADLIAPDSLAGKKKPIRTTSMKSLDQHKPDSFGTPLVQPKNLKFGGETPGKRVGRSQTFMGSEMKKNSRSPIPSLTEEHKPTESAALGESSKPSWGQKLMKGFNMFRGDKKKTKSHFYDPPENNVSLVKVAPLHPSPPTSHHQ